MNSEELDENARAFLAQIDAIKATDVGEERLKAFTSEADFNGIAVELLVEVGSYVCVAANLLPRETHRWNRNQAILGGHLVRLYKLISALLDQICQRRREIAFIVARLAFECIVNLRYLIKLADDPEVFDSYVAHSMRQEKRLYDKIQEQITSRGGNVLPVESRMLNSIAKVAKASEIHIEDISASRPRNWADKTLAERADAVGLGEAYLGSFGGASAAIHGSWMDLLEFQLDTNHEEVSFAPRFEWANPRPQIGQTVAYLATEAARDYFNFMGEGPLEFMDEKFDELASRIRVAARAHDAFLVSTNAF
ncbi:MAG: hypothetical protein JWP51_5167 [Bradyrhizobium sp.]|nr:hypothetical protein [Bradyrhizobium sp.]